MAQSNNKKVLFFIDEYGTAGKGDLYFGGVIALAKHTGRLDKCFSDQLEENAHEIHAVKMDNEYLKDLMMRFWQSSPQDNIVLINRKVSIQHGSAPVLYAQGLIETVKVGLKSFKKKAFNQEYINNVEVIIDSNHHNNHRDFEAEISEEKSKGSTFRAVNHVAKIDSAASRMLQLADIVAYSRKFINDKKLNAQQLNEQCGIQIK